jgi:hypothetical protein
MRLLCSASKRYTSAGPRYSLRVRRIEHMIQRVGRQQSQPRLTTDSSSSLLLDAGIFHWRPAV